MINKIIEQLTPEQKSDSKIFKFLTRFVERSRDEKWIQYLNGNGIIEISTDDGTLITTVLNDEDFSPSFPCNTDINVSNFCENNCQFCYQGCSPQGKDADLIKFINSKYYKSIKAGVEMAINGNHPIHSDIEILLKENKSRNIISNITVRLKKLIIL